MPALLTPLCTAGIVHDVPLGHGSALRVVVSSQLLRFRGTNTLLMTSTRILQLVCDLETSKPRRSQATFGRRLRRSDPVGTDRCRSSVYASQEVVDERAHSLVSTVV